MIAGDRCHSVSQALEDGDHDEATGRTGVPAPHAVYGGQIESQKGYIVTTCCNML